MKDHTLPFKAKAGSLRFITRHPNTLLKCVRPVQCSKKAGQITRYIEYDANTGIGTVYYTRDEGLRDMESSSEFSGELGLVTYLAIWLRCEQIEGGWPIPGEAAYPEQGG